MAQVNTIVGRAEATYVGEEAVAFGTTAASLLRTFPVTSDAGGLNVDGLAQDMVDVDDESVYLFDAKTPAFGLKGGTAKMQHYSHCDGTQLTQGSGAVADWPLGCLLRCSLGAEAPALATANPGELVAAAGSSTTQVTVTTSGARFVAGQWAAVEISGTIEPFYITSISGQNLAVRPTLSGTPTATTGIVVAGRTYAPDQANTKSMTWQKAMASDSAHQWTMNGVVVTPEFMWEMGKIPMWTFNGNVATWTGPSAQSLSTAVGSQTGASKFTTRSSTVLFQPVSTLTRTSQYSIRSMSIKLNSGREFVPGVGGDIEGKAGVITNGERKFAEIDLVLTGSDTVMDSSNWSSQTPMQLIVFSSNGSLLTKRLTGVHVPTCQIIGKPQFTRQGKQAATALKLMAQLDSVTTGTTAMATAPIRFFHI